MGIRGLAGTLKKCQQFKRPEFFEGGIFYIDALNLFHDVGEKVTRRPSVTNDKEARVIAVIERDLAYFRRLKPSKIYLVTDAYFPVDKIPVKVARRQQQLFAQKAPHMARYAVGWVMKQNFADIELIFSGLEGETAILQHIYETSEQTKNCAKFIFSNDSDTYTFDLPNKRLVFGVPLGDNIHSRGADVICLQDAWRLIPSEHRVALPIKQIPESVFNPKKQILGLIETVNLIAYDNIFCVFITNCPTPYASNASFIGDRYRRVKNAHILNMYFHGRDMEISEYVEDGFHIVCQKAKKASPDEVKAVMRDVLTLPAPTLVYNEFKRTQSDHNFSDAEIDAIYRFCNDILLGKVQTGRVPSSRTYQAKALLFHLLTAIKMLISTCLIPRSLGEIAKEINEFQLCAYIA